LTSEKLGITFLARRNAGHDLSVGAASSAHFACFVLFSCVHVLFSPPLPFALLSF
jgi:hypothetical protein